MHDGLSNEDSTCNSWFIDPAGTSLAFEGTSPFQEHHAGDEERGEPRHPRHLPATLGVVFFTSANARGALAGARLLAVDSAASAVMTWTVSQLKSPQGALGARRGPSWCSPSPALPPHPAAARPRPARRALTSFAVGARGELAPTMASTCFRPPRQRSDRRYHGASKPSTHLHRRRGSLGTAQRARWSSARSARITPRSGTSASPWWCCGRRRQTYSRATAKPHLSSDRGPLPQCNQPTYIASARKTLEGLATKVVLENRRGSCSRATRRGDHRHRRRLHREVRRLRAAHLGQSTPRTNGSPRRAGSRRPASSWNRPGGPRLPWWRAEDARNRQGKLEAAAVDFRLALSLEPHEARSHHARRRTLFKLGRRVTRPLEQLLCFHPERRTASGIATRLGRSTPRGATPSPRKAAPSSLPKGGSAITARVKVNGRRWAPSSSTPAPPRWCCPRRSPPGGHRRPNRTVKIRTAAGIREGQLTTLS